MRIRTSQFLFAAALMLACIGVVYFMEAIEMEGMHDVNRWALFSFAGLVIFYVLIRSGISERMNDPSLAFEQMLYAIACDAAAFVISGHGRGVTMPILSVILMFGMFGLSMRQVVVIAIYGMTLFGFSSWLVLLNPTTDESAGLFAAYFFMLFIVVSATTFLTWRLQRITSHIKRQRNQLEEAFEKIQKIATHDDLTGVANRRYMLERIRQEAERAQRTTSPLLVAMLDIDRFKLINDRYGHQQGDQVLQMFAAVVQENIRANDTLARWGGEEFVVLLPDTDINVGDACLVRVLNKVAETDIPMGNERQRISVSIGVTQYNSGESIDRTLARADTALYQAKSSGRNQIRWASSTEIFEAPT